MNLRSRLKKIENRITKSDSEFCQCEKEVVFKIEPYSESQNLCEPIICELCGKLERQMFFTFNFNHQTEVILPKLDEDLQ